MGLPLGFRHLTHRLASRPSLLLKALRRGPRACVDELLQTVWHAAIVSMPPTANGIRKTCSSFILDAKDGDADTLLVRLKSGERFLIRRKCVAKDIWLLRQTFFRTCWLSDYDVRNQLVLNLGANLGDTAVYFGLRGASVVAWEPSEELAKLAKRNCALNGVTAEINAQGIGDSRGTMTLVSSGRSADAASTISFPNQRTKARASFEGGCHESVAVLSFGEVLDRFSNVYLAQINCEGCEYPALISLDDRQVRKVDHYAVDCHGSPQMISERLKKAGYLLRKQQGLTLFADRVG